MKNQSVKDQLNRIFILDQQYDNEAMSGLDTTKTVEKIQKEKEKLESHKERLQKYSETRLNDLGTGELDIIERISDIINEAF